LDAPGLAAVLAAEEGVGQEVVEPPEVPVAAGGPTFVGQIGPLFEQRCTTCHSQVVATGALVLETYNAAMIGGSSGPVITPGDAESSLLIQRQRDGHFGQFTDEELQLVIDWINSGAPES
jgi:hypothetical protein